MKQASRAVHAGRGGKAGMGARVPLAPDLSTAAVHDDLVYISEDEGYLHCLDAKTGKQYWEHDFKGAIWG